MKIIFTQLFVLRMAFAFCLFEFGIASSVSAQIIFTDNAQLKAETRRNQREAALIEADYKESHLDIANVTYKKGKINRKRVKKQNEWESYQFDDYGNALYKEPVKLIKLKFKRQANQKK